MSKIILVYDVKVIHQRCLGILLDNPNGVTASEINRGNLTTREIIEYWIINRIEQITLCSLKKNFLGKHTDNKLDTLFKSVWIPLDEFCIPSHAKPIDYSFASGSLYITAEQLDP